MGANARYGRNNKWNYNVRLNKRAFDRVLEKYLEYATRRSVSAVKYDGESGSEPNPAKPSQSDFCCDVERTVQNTLNNKNQLKNFILEYIIELDTLKQGIKSNIEQRIGNAFRKRGIYPIHGKRGYFTSIRKGVSKEKYGQPSIAAN